MSSMPSTRPMSPLPSRTSLAIRTPARGLCENRTAQAEGSDKHGNDDQFLYHFVNSSKDRAASRVERAYITDQNVTQWLDDKQRATVCVLRF